MKNLFIIYFLIFWTLTNFVFAQKINISGEIINSKNDMLNEVKVLLYKQDSPHVINTSINEKGKFNIEIEKGNYTLQIKHSEDILFKKSIIANKDLNLGTIEINTHKEIESVMIKGQKKAIEHKLDRIVFNLDNVTSPTGSAIDVLEKTPQVTINENDISIIGKETARIMINDRIINLSGDELRNYLQGIPANNIKSIELISNPPAKYDVDGNGGLINIILKSTKIDSWNLSLSQYYRQSSRPGSNSNIDFNYKKDKILLSLGLGYNPLSLEATQKINYIYPDQKWNIASKSINDTKNSSINLDLDYEISKKLNIGFLSYILNSNKEKGRLNSRSSISGNNFFDFIDTNTNDDANLTLSYLNIYGIYNIDSTGKKLNIDVNTFQSRFPKNPKLTTSKYFSENKLIDYYEFNNPTRQDLENYSISADMTHPTNWIDLEYGAKVTFNKTNNKSVYQNIIPRCLINSVFVNCTTIDKFIYKENYQAVYISGSKNLDKKWTVKAGIRTESFQTKGNSISLNQINKQDQIKLFPSAYIGYSLKNEDFLSLSYSRRIERPSFLSVNPFRTYTNPYAYYEGNASLEPSYTNNVEASYSHKNYNATLYYSKVENSTQVINTFFNDQYKTNISKPENAFNSDIIGLRQYYKFSLKDVKWWGNSYEATIFYSENKSPFTFFNDQKNTGWSYYFSTNNFIYLTSKKNFIFNINWRYFSRGPRKMEYKSSHNNLSASFKILMLNKDLQITLQGNDILGSDRIRTEIMTNNILETYTKYSDYYTQYFQLSISYTIGNKNIRGTNKDSGVEEASRL